MENSRHTSAPDGKGFKPMLHLQHNVVNILCAITNRIHHYFDRYERSGFKDPNEALKEAHARLKKIAGLTRRAYEITRRVSLAMRAQRLEDEPLGLVSIKEVWKDTLEILGKRYAFQWMDVIEHIPDAFPLIECNPSELFEIFYYLVQNAIQAMAAAGGNRSPLKRATDSSRALVAGAANSGGPLRGKLVIRANREFRAGDKTAAVITISDTGPGIPEAALTRLFEPFFTTKPVREGNGLGLCLVKGLVKRNRGGISVSSFEGCGTTFTLSFQVGQAAQPGHQAACAAMAG